MSEADEIGHVPSAKQSLPSLGMQCGGGEAGEGGWLRAGATLGGGGWLRASWGRRTGEGSHVRLHGRMPWSGAVGAGLWSPGPPRPRTCTRQSMSSTATASTRFIRRRSTHTPLQPGGDKHAHAHA